MVLLVLRLILFVVFPLSGMAQSESARFKKQESGFYRDVFDRNIYDEGTGYLHIERLYRRISHHKLRAADVNAYDEVPDSAFFTNRHARRVLSESEIEKGYQESDGPDLSGNLVVTSGRFSGSVPMFFVKDAKGEEYLLKFDPVDSLGLATSSEVIAGRFYHAIGYNVPQTTIIKLDPSKLVPTQNAKMADDSGFKKNLTAKKLQDYVLFLPQENDGRLRASAAKLLSGEDKGNFHFKGRRKNDPDDTVDHSTRREIRALRVFSSWMNNNDVREGNTADRLTDSPKFGGIRPDESRRLLADEKGEKILKHYLVNFNSSLGAAGDGVKPPMFSHEHLFDYGEAVKAFFTLGLWEKPWQKRWREAGEKAANPPAVGYFDNRYFDPGRFKTELPAYAFKDLTRADAFWAAKIIMSFSDADIHAAVKAGQLSDSKDEDYLAQTLAERRDIIGKYWFKKTNPLDEFDLKENKLVFKDLAVSHGFAAADGTSYQVGVYQKGKRQAYKIASPPQRRRIRPLAERQIREPALDLENWRASGEGVVLAIRTSRAENSKLSPAVLVEVSPQGVSGIIHED